MSIEQLNNISIEALKKYLDENHLTAVINDGRIVDVVHED